MPSTQWVLRPSFLLRCEPLSHGGRMVISSSSVSLPTFSFPPDGSAFSCVFDGALCPAWCTLSSPVYKNSVFLLRPAWAPLSFCWQTSAYNRFSFSHWYLTLCGLVLPIDVSAESSSRAKIYVWSMSVSLIPAHCKDHSRCLLSICWMIKKKKISGPLEPSPLSMECDQDRETSRKNRTQEVLWDEAGLCTGLLRLELALDHVVSGAPLERGAHWWATDWPTLWLPFGDVVWPLAGLHAQGISLQHPLVSGCGAGMPASVFWGYQLLPAYIELNSRHDL